MSKKLSERQKQRSKVIASLRRQLCPTNTYMLSVDMDPDLWVAGVGEESRIAQQYVREVHSFGLLTTPRS